MDWAAGEVLHLINTWFLRRKSWLIKFRLGEIETFVNYILVNNLNKSSVKDVKVIPGEEIRVNIVFC